MTTTHATCDIDNDCICAGGKYEGCVPKVDIYHASEWAKLLSTGSLPKPKRKRMTQSRLTRLRKLGRDPSKYSDPTPVIPSEEFRYIVYGRLESGPCEYIEATCVRDSEHLSTSIDSAVRSESSTPGSTTKECDGAACQGTAAGFAIAFVYPPRIPNLPDVPPGVRLSPDEDRKRIEEYEKARKKDTAEWRRALLGESTPFFTKAERIELQVQAGEAARRNAQLAATAACPSHLCLCTELVEGELKDFPLIVVAYGDIDSSEPDSHPWSGEATYVNSMQYGEFMIVAKCEVTLTSGKCRRIG